MELSAAVADLTGQAVLEWQVLKSSGRNLVARAVLDGSGPVIAKAPNKELNVRERAALQVLNGIEAPRLLACAGKLIVLADFGPGPSLADHLLGDDPDRAAAGVLNWARAIARCQAASVDAGPAFAAALTSFAPDDPPQVDTMIQTAREAAGTLAELLPALGVEPAPEALAELVAAADLGPGPRAMTPGDACPDNNVEQDGRLRLIDFEWADYRHVAWDAAYLKVPWPTCWCCWRLPDAVSDAAMDAWRETLALPVPAAVIDRAVLVWSMVAASYPLPRALGSNPGGHVPGRPLPDRRALVQDRFATAVEHAEPGSALHKLATDALAAAVDKWGRLVLPPAPAWR